MNEPSNNPQQIIYAAGGIVHRQTFKGWEIAVVYRKSNDDWSLPKWNMEANEPPEKTLLRKIREETGCEGTILGFAGTTQYIAGNTPNIVFYWKVNVCDGISGTQSEDTRVEWFCCKEAIKRLTHKEEITLISRAFPYTFESTCPSVWRHRFSKHHRRLCNDIQVTRVDIDDFIERGCGREDDYFNRIDLALSCLRLAEQGLRNRDYNGGWKHLHKTRQTLLFVLSDRELSAKLVVQKQEAAGMLAFWRIKAYDDLIDKNMSADKVSVTNIAEAQGLMDEHTNNKWLKVWAMRSQLQIIAAIISIVVISIVFLLDNMFQMFGPDPADANWQFILVVAMFGVLGASFSGALSIANVNTEERIPEQLVSYYVTVMRLALGGGAAVAMYCFLQTKIIQITNLNDPFGFFSVSFVAGFGERLIIKAVETLTGKQDNNGKSKNRK